MTAPLDHPFHDAAQNDEDDDEIYRRPRWQKWAVIVIAALVVASLLWLYAFPYVTTLLPENF